MSLAFLEQLLRVWTASPSLNNFSEFEQLFRTTVLNNFDEQLLNKLFKLEQLSWTTFGKSCSNLDNFLGQLLWATFFISDNFFEQLVEQLFWFWTTFLNNLLDNFFYFEQLSWTTLLDNFFYFGQLFCCPWKLFRKVVQLREKLSRKVVQIH